MKLLRELLYQLDCDRIIGNTNSAISSLHFNSNNVLSASLFVAIKGINNNGHNFITAAIESGAIAIVCEDIPKERISHVTYIKVSNSSLALGVLASNFFDNPSNNIKLIGVTGTNGKTSTVFHLFDLFRGLGFRVGLLSTIEQKINNKVFPYKQTTPDPIETNKLLSMMIKDNCEFCFMEVSSHGISQNRISGLSFDIGVFTNITRDHLDYHQSFNQYIATKKLFFDSLSKEAKSIVNADDEYASTMLIDTNSKKIFFSLKKTSNYHATVIENNIDGLALELEKMELSTKLIGKFNAYNLLAAYSVAIELNQDKMSVLNLLSNLESPAGRFNIIKSKSGIIGIVDYAHTPDALKKIIVSISNFCTINKNLIIVVGCGGDRDQGKRSIMGKIASEHASLAIFTSDNPRFENPESIINDMSSDLSDTLCKKVHKIINREEAICFAVNNASKESIILVAGKGHEKFQEISGEKTPFDDFKILEKLLKP